MKNHYPKNLNKYMIKFNPVSPNSGRKKGKYSLKQINKAKKLIKKVHFI